METATTHSRAIDRVRVLLDKGTNVLFQGPENVFVNAPVAIQQIAFQNELNGILLGLGLPTLRVLKLPISYKDRKQILDMMKRFEAL